MKSGSRDYMYSHLTFCGVSLAAWHGVGAFLDCLKAACLFFLSLLFLLLDTQGRCHTRALMRRQGTNGCWQRWGGRCGTRAALFLFHTSHTCLVTSEVEAEVGTELDG